MNLALPTYRNSFHPGWLLLMVVPTAGLALLAVDFDLNALKAFGLQTILAAAVVLPLVYWRNAEAPAAVRRWMKELRVLLLPLLVSVGVPCLIGLGQRLWRMPDSVQDVNDWMTGLCCFGSLVAGALVFGEEFEHRTLGGLLSQPQSRWSVYSGKLMPLGVVLVWSGINLAVLLAASPGGSPGLDSNRLTVAALLLAVVFCTTPFYTLLTRSTLAGAIFTAAVPLLAFLIGRLAAAVLSRIPVGQFADPEMDRALLYATPAYLVCCAWMGWRTFRELEVRDGGAGGAGTSSVSHPMSLPVDRILARMLPGAPWGQLVRKEARLHVVPWLVAGMMIGVWGVYCLIQWIRTRDPEAAGILDPGGVGILYVLMGMLTLLVSGAACVAEERGMGTLDWQLTQPVSVNCQWWVKVLVAWVHFVGLGVLLPCLLFGTLAGWRQLWGDPTSDSILAIAVFTGVAMLAFAIAVHASSFSRSTMKASASAVLMAVFLVALPGPFVAFTGVRMNQMSSEFEGSGPVAAPAWEPDGVVLQAVAVGFGVALVGLVVTLLLVFGRRNFAQASVSRRSLARQGLALVLILVPILFLASETLLQGTRLGIQGGLYRAQEARLGRSHAALRELLEWQHDRKGISAAFLTGAGLATNAPLDDALRAAAGMSDPDVLETWVRSVYEEVLAGAGGVPESLLVSDVRAMIYSGIPAVRLIDTRVREASRTNAAITTVTNQVLFRMDPVLARRYGLKVHGAGVPAQASAPATNAPVHLIDPVLARRYGLSPAPQRTEAPAPPK